MVNKNYCFLNFIYAKIKKYDKIIYVDILYIGSGSMDQKRIGNLIKELRKKNNLTQEKFAEKYGEFNRGQIQKNSALRTEGVHPPLEKPIFGTCQA